MKIKNFIIEKIKLILNYRQSAVFKLVFFVLFFILVYIASITITEISFLESLDLTNPNNVAELQPLVDSTQRKIGLIGLFVTFATVAIAIGRWQGFASVLSLILSIFTIYKLIIPLLLNGWNPPLVTIIGGTIVITASLLFSHGFNLKTLFALIGGTTSLVVSMILGEIFRLWIQVSGYHGEATYNLLSQAQINYDMSGIVLAGIIFAGIGLLDDITITQTSVIKEIINSNPKLKFKEIYKKAMNVGRDHAGALINSLFWAYAAASFTLIMALSYFGIDFEGFISYEFFMEEVLRVFVSSTGLLLSIPITTFLGAYFMKKYERYLSKDEEGHHHHHH